MLVAVEEFSPMWLGRVSPDAARQILRFHSRDGVNFTPGPPVNTHWSHEFLSNAAGPLSSIFPRIGANPDSTKFVDRVYCIWAGNRTTAGNRPGGERIFVSVSRDGGEVWDRPVVHSEQAHARNEADDYLAAVPSVAVDRNGVVAVSWYDRRGLPPSGPPGKPRGWNVRARLSAGGGRTWLPSVRLNGEESRGEFGVGHTAGLAATADGGFQALWIDSRDTTRQLRTTSFGVASE